ncbi:hypothetical protein QTG56_25090 (plasmid) [Rossellomorea sp. AcN35-11]|nr:hypothetical protein [Rossellomorea aquimaris]WJV31910.1 hypothetical protein QTG56_25090 [Rossellomorea sp. AcN35-11]
MAEVDQLKEAYEEKVEWAYEGPYEAIINTLDGELKAIFKYNGKTYVRLVDESIKGCTSPEIRYKYDDYSAFNEEVGIRKQTGIFEKVVLCEVE